MRGVLAGKRRDQETLFPKSVHLEKRKSYRARSPDFISQMPGDSIRRYQSNSGSPGTEWAPLSCPGSQPSLGQRRKWQLAFYLARKAKENLDSKSA